MQRCAMEYQISRIYRATQWCAYSRGASADLTGRKAFQKFLIFENDA